MKKLAGQKLTSFISCIAVIAASMCVCAAFLLPEKETPVTTEISDFRIMTVQITAQGVIEKESQRVVLPVFSGIVGDVYVKEGDFVEAGQALFRMDSAFLEEELASGAAQLKLASRLLEDSEDYAVLTLKQEALMEKIAACVVRAPIGGKVLSVSVESGMIAQGGILIGSGGLKIRAFIPDGDADKIGIGQKAVIFRGVESAEGFVSFFSASETRQGYFEAVISCPKSQVFFENLPLGIQVDVSIITDEYTKVCVPIEALLYGEDAVMCAVEGVAVKREVELFDQDAYFIAVDGLPCGVEVIISPGEIKQGDKVKNAGGEKRDEKN